MPNIIIDYDKCEACGDCVETCPAEVLEMQDGKPVVVNIDECLECESCVEVCEPGAVTMEED
jgi:NAD-dependent dihydropyrimidine dehydrogenase PreA subunit